MPMQISRNTGRVQAIGRLLLFLLKPFEPVSVFGITATASLYGLQDFGKIA
jgi:hypothetical protein